MILAIAEAPGSQILPQLILIFVLTLLNAILAASELAILSANMTKMQILSDAGNKKAKIVLDFNENETKFLSTIQVGITLAGLFSSATAATSMSTHIATFLTKFNLPYMPEVSMVVITIILAYITLVFGELFPKRIALRFSDKVSLFVAPCIKFLTIIAKPFVKFLTFSCNILVRITRLEKNIKDEKISEEEIKSVLQEGEEDGIITSAEHTFMNRVFNLNDLTAQNIMTPRTKTFAVDINDQYEEIFNQLKEAKYTRVPVYNESLDNIIGILNVKDILFNTSLDGNKIDIKTILRKPLFVPKSISLRALLKEFLETNNQIAILTDEFGGVLGIVTLEDVLEELVGDIFDEFDVEEIKKINNNTFQIPASLSIIDFNRYFKAKMSLSEDYNSLGGFVINELGYFPSDADNVIVDTEFFTFEIEKFEGNKIESLIVRKKII